MYKIDVYMNYFQNGSIHLVGCWFLLLSINIGIGQMINVDADYQNNNTNIT